MLFLFLMWILTSNCKGLLQDKGLYLSVFNTGILWLYILVQFVRFQMRLITFCYRLKTVLCNLCKTNFMAKLFTQQICLKIER